MPIARTVIGTSRVARFLDADPLAGRPWLAMEYVAGRMLVACVDEDGVLPVPLVAGLGALLAEGVSAVHAAELLHRDLKPQNVIMGKEALMIIDFGVGAFMDAAKESLSHSGMIIGTVRCMPPEQASRHPKVTPAADVYALGAVAVVRDGSPLSVRRHGVGSRRRAGGEPRHRSRPERRATARPSSRW